MQYSMFQNFKVLEIFAERPVIGMAGGFGSGILMSAQSLVSDEKVLQTVSNIGIYCGVLVAMLTVVLKAMELVDAIRKRVKH